MAVPVVEVGADVKEEEERLEKSRELVVGLNWRVSLGSGL